MRFEPKRLALAPLLVGALWAEDDNISCIHPGGQRLDGRAAVHQSWEQIFEHSQDMQFRLTDLSHFYDQSLAVHVLHEHIRLGENGNFQPPVIATNVYRLTDNGWRMVLHHASATRVAGQQPPNLH